MGSFLMREVPLYAPTSGYELSLDALQREDVLGPRLGRERSFGRQELRYKVKEPDPLSAAPRSLCLYGCTANFISALGDVSNRLVGGFGRQPPLGA